MKLNEPAKYMGLFFLVGGGFALASYLMNDSNVVPVFPEKTQKKEARSEKKAALKSFKKIHNRLQDILEREKISDENILLAAGYCEGLERFVDLKFFPEMDDEMDYVEEKCPDVLDEIYNRIVKLHKQGKKSIEKEERKITWNRWPFIKANSMCNYLETTVDMEKHSKFAKKLKKRHAQIRWAIINFERDYIHQLSVAELWSIDADAPYYPEKRARTRKKVHNFYDEHFERVAKEYDDIFIARNVRAALSNDYRGWSDYLKNGDEWPH